MAPANIAESHSKSTLQDAKDAIVRITTTTICGTKALASLRNSAPLFRHLSITSCRKCDFCCGYWPGWTGRINESAALFTGCDYSIELDDNRLKASKNFNATVLVNSRDGRAVEKVVELTNCEGVDVSIEAVGLPATFDIRCCCIWEAAGSPCYFDDQSGGCVDNAEASEIYAVECLAVRQIGDALLRAERHCEGVQHVCERRQA